MYRRHRERLLQRLAERECAAIFPSGTAPVRNHDSHYLFRPHSDFWYLTGFGEPDSVLVLSPGHPDGEAVLFLRERDPKEEIWNGRRLGTRAAPEALGVDRALPIEALWQELPELLKGHGGLIYQSGLDDDRDRRLIATLAGMRRQVRGGLVWPQQQVDPATLLHELRLFKSADELAIMRRAAAISDEAHRAAMAAAEPGRGEREIDALLSYTFRRRGGSGPAYNNIVAGGANACVLHYNENDDVLRDGELLLIDAGAEVDCYASDVTRTFPVNGRFSDEQRALYEVVLDAQLAALEECRPGKAFLAPHERAVERIAAGLVDLGLLAGPPEAVVEEKRYERFYMHRTGHWLGLDVHDCGAYYVDGASRALAEGMVLTVEPGLYVAPDDESVEARWRGIGIRIEDDVAITASGREVLTAAIPKATEEVEAACSGATLQPAR